MKILPISFSCFRGKRTFIRATRSMSLALLSCSLIAACSIFSDDRDRVLEGSLTLTPLRLPKEAAAPDHRNALRIPNIPYTDNPNEKQEELEKPPILDTALANELEKKLGSAVDQKKAEVKSFPVSMVDGDGGIAQLTVDGEFDLIWPYMENVLEKLGFKITDHNRSEHLYYISRSLSTTVEDKEQEKTTGVARTVGVEESYQIEVSPKSGDDNAALIRVRNSLGQLENTALSRHILAQIKAYLEQPLK